MKTLVQDTRALLAVFAHPDDETFRPGGTLALLARHGVGVHVLTATRGQAGSRGDPPRCTQEELPAVRERELRCACAALDVEPPRLLDYQDGHLAEVSPEEITEHILAALAEIDPQVVLTFGPDGLSGHADHIAIGRCAALAYARCEDVAAIYALAVPRSLAEQAEMRQVHSVPDEQITLAVDVASAWPAKQAAMACHMTQRSSTPLMGAPEARQRQFFGHEFFVCAACRRPDKDFMPLMLKGYGG
jgi:LmbE family N-acetylglucosaminyl deacetylase